MYYISSYKSPFCLESAIISCPFNTVLRAPLLVQHPISLYTGSLRELLVLTTHTGNDVPFCCLGPVQVKYPTGGFRGPGTRTGASSHLLSCSWAGQVQPSWAHPPAPGWTCSAHHGLSLLICSSHLWQSQLTFW